MANIEKNIKSRVLNRYPGDRAQKLLAPIVCVGGRALSRGCVFVPIAGGAINGVAGASKYQDLSVDGESLRVLIA